MPAGQLEGAILGAYRLVEFLGAGGMGEVYRAQHTRLDRMVAVKVLTNAGHAPGMVDRFRNEAQIQASLHHPNLATLFDFLELDGRPCIMMEYVDGHTLDTMVRAAGGLPPARALAILVDLARAVGYLHSHGIVHRDLKCANVKVTSRGVVKLLDFGLAKGPVTPKLTATGHVVGTFDYMAPEQLTQGPVDGRTDLWALGVMLYELVTGRLPFAAGGTLEQMSRVIEARYFPASTLVAGLPEGVDALIGRCLRPDPGQRFPTADALATETERVLASLSSSSRALAMPVEGEGPTRFRLPALGLPRFSLPSPRVTVPVTAGLVAIVAVVALLSRPGPPDPPPPPPPRSPAALAACGVAAAELVSNRIRVIEITVVGGAADVYCGDQVIGRTPYPLRAELGRTVNLILRERGWVDKPVAFTVSEGMRVFSFVLDRPSRRGSPGAAATLPLTVLAMAGWWPFGRRRKAGGAVPETRVLERAAGPEPLATNASLAALGGGGGIVIEIRSDPGCVRENNEDSIGFFQPADAEALNQDGVLLVVADGMGGHSGGEVASRLAVETVVRHYARDNQDPQAALSRAVRLANQAIQLQARSDAALKGMGTTCTALVLRQGCAYCAHVGDSRLYLVRGGDILQLTEDHSAVMHMVKKGMIDREGARVHPDRNVIERALGSRADVEVAEWAQPLFVRHEDRFLVSSDGLHDLVQDAEILEAVSTLAPAAACDRLVALARSRGGHDNISVGILTVGAAPADGDLDPEPQAAA